MLRGIGRAAKWIGRGIQTSGARTTVGKGLVGASVGAAAVGGAVSETLNPDGYAGDVVEDLTGSRDFHAQMFGASVRTSFTASQPRMGRPGRRRPQAPPGDIVFGMYNLR